MTTTISLESDDTIDPYELIVVGSTFAELLPFLRLADRTGVPTMMTPATTDETKNARQLSFALQTIADPKELAAFVLAAVAIGEDLGSDGMLDTVLNDAKALRNEALNDLHGPR